MKILKKSERRRGPEGWFTGEVWMQPVAKGSPTERAESLYVEFAPGARTAWHTHPVGQVLEVISGKGWVQLEGEAARAIGVGDVVVIEAGENHWHGAQADGPMVHLAINAADAAGSNVAWGAQVTDAEFAAAGKS